jgi:hypothetical protein
MYLWMFGFGFDLCSVCAAGCVIWRCGMGFYKITIVLENKITIMSSGKFGDDLEVCK